MGEWGTVNIHHRLVIYGTLVEHDLLEVHVVCHTVWKLLDVNILNLAEELIVCRLCPPLSIVLMFASAKPNLRSRDRSRRGAAKEKYKRLLLKPCQ